MVIPATPRAQDKHVGRWCHLANGHTLSLKIRLFSTCPLWGKLGVAHEELTHTEQILVPYGSLLKGVL